MSTGLKANSDGSAAIQVGGTDYIQIASTGPVTIPGNLVVTGTATVGGQPVGSNYALNSYVAPATWTKPANLKAVKVTVIGAGGTGGPATGATPGTPAIAGWGGGGGGGGASIYYAPAPSIPGPISVTAGPGTNSFGALASATAGSNGSAAPAGTPAAAGGAGGAGASGSVNITGQAGNYSNAPSSGLGGSSILGGGGAAVAANSNGNAGGNYGGGGSGAARSGTPGTNTGGAGAPGIVIVEEFY